MPVTKPAEQLPKYTPTEEPAVVGTPSSTIFQREDPSSPGSSTVTKWCIDAEGARRDYE